MENTSLEEKVKNREAELSQARTQIERMSSAKVNEVLSAQKPNFDKTGLGYAVSSMASGSRTVFVPQSEEGDKGMKSKTNLTNSKSFVNLIFVTIVVFLDTFVLIVLSCILLKSKCPNGHRFPLKDL